MKIASNLSTSASDRRCSLVRIALDALVFEHLDNPERVVFQFNKEAMAIDMFNARDKVVKGYKIIFTGTGPSMIVSFSAKKFDLPEFEPFRSQEVHIQYFDKFVRIFLPTHMVEAIREHRGVGPVEQTISDNGSVEPLMSDEITSSPQALVNGSAVKPRPPKGRKSISILDVFEAIKLVQDFIDSTGGEYQLTTTSDGRIDLVKNPG